MNPGTSETSGLNLPPPVGEIAPPAVDAAKNRLSDAEQLPAAPETKSRTGQSAAGLPIIPLPLPASGPTAATTDQPAAPSDDSATNLADEDDLIEKEWINKAKAIVERTRDDPHKQSQELTVVKADYMKQRYNKTVKVNN
jgi:hypothetical protein